MNDEVAPSFELVYGRYRTRLVRMQGSAHRADRAVAAEFSGCTIPSFTYLRAQLTRPGGGKYGMRLGVRRLHRSLRWLRRIGFVERIRVGTCSCYCKKARWESLPQRLREAVRMTPSQGVDLLHSIRESIHVATSAQPEAGRKPGVPSPRDGHPRRVQGASPRTRSRSH